MPTPRDTCARLPRDERTFSDVDFLGMLDLRRRGLGAVRRALARGHLPAARAAAVEYFRTRRTPKWSFDLRDGRRGGPQCAWVSPPTPDSRGRYNRAVTARADEVCRHALRLAADLPHDFGPGLGWRTKQMRGLLADASILKRCNWMRDLAAAHARTRNGKYAAKFDHLLNRWLDDWPLVVDEDFNPAGAILHAADGHKAMPTAFRVISWLDCLYCGVPFAPQVAIDTAFRLIKSTVFTALQYRRYAPSPYRPANHHLWERGTAPFVFGVMFPEFPELAKMVAQGRPVIKRHLRHSFLPDGGYEERTTSYTYAALKMFTLPLWLARLNRVPLLSRKETGVLRRCGDNLALLTLPHGHWADVGDGMQHVGRVSEMLSESVRLFRSPTALAVGASLGLAGRLDREARPALKAAAGQRLPLVVHQPDSGYFVARDAWSARASAMALSVPHGGIFNHAHDDAMSLQLVVRGEPIIGTPLSELYHVVNTRPYVRRLVRQQFYDAASHNVVLVGGPRKLSTPDRPTWGVVPEPVTTRWTETGDSVRVSCCQERATGATVVREVLFRHRRGWTVRDGVAGVPGARCVARWHFEYGVAVTREGRLFLAQAGQAVLAVGCTSDGPIQTRLYRDGRWLGKNPRRPGEPAPWALDVTFDGRLVTVFEIG